MIFRLQGPSKNIIESRIPFNLNRDGDFIPATENYSYVFRGKEVLQEAEYDDNGNMTKPPVLSNYVLANINIYNDTGLNIGDEVQRRFPENPKHGWT